MNIVVMGAGATGATYAHHLQRGGAHLTFLVREKYAAEVKRGIAMYQVVRGRKPRAHTLTPDDVVTDVAQLKGKKIDQVWLCVPTTGVDEAFLRGLADATGDACLVDLSADGERRLRRTVAAERVVEGGVPLIAYQAPLPGVASEGALFPAPGIAYWLPPMAKTPFSGARAQHCVDALKAGGMGARRVADAGRQRALASAMFNTVIAHLECADWKLAACRARIDGASKEALAVAVRECGGSAGPLNLVVQPATLRAALALAPKVIPLPLEPYLQFHFTKVGQQTRNSLAITVARAEKFGLDVPHLRALHASLGARPLAKQIA